MKYKTTTNADKDKDKKLKSIFLDVSLFIFLLMNPITFSLAAENTTQADPKLLAPRWEQSAKNPDTLQYRRAWTVFTKDFIKKNAPALLNGPKDVTSFCKHYSTLNLDHKLDFWAYFISAVVQLESNFNPYESYHESSLGNDSVTQRPVRSEGLMQVSYQDKHYPYCNQFNWEEDKNKSVSDPTKTIFNPLLNLACGIGIIHRLAEKNNHLVLKNAYYDVLRYRWKRWGEDALPVEKIMTWTQSLPICKSPQTYEQNKVTTEVPNSDLQSPDTSSSITENLNKDNTSTETSDNKQTSDLLDNENQGSTLVPPDDLVTYPLDEPMNTNFSETPTL